MSLVHLRVVLARNLLQQARHENTLGWMWLEPSALVEPPSRVSAPMAFPYSLRRQSVVHQRAPRHDAHCSVTFAVRAAPSADDGVELEPGARFLSGLESLLLCGGAACRVRIAVVVILAAIAVSGQRMLVVAQVATGGRVAVGQWVAIANAFVTDRTLVSDRTGVVVDTRAIRATTGAAAALCAGWAALGRAGRAAGRAVLGHAIAIAKALCAWPAVVLTDRKTVGVFDARRLRNADECSARAGATALAPHAACAAPGFISDVARRSRARHCAAAARARLRESTGPCVPRAARTTSAPRLACIAGVRGQPGIVVVGAATR